MAPAIPEPAVLVVAGDEPETNGELRGVEELAGQGDHAIDQIGLDDVLADVPLARLVGRHRAVCQNKTGQPGWGQVIDEMLNPGEVGIAGRWGAKLPSLVVLQE